MTTQDNDNDAEAAEYVLGTLRGPERRRFETRLARDAKLRRSVERWSNVIDPLHHMVPPVRPRPQVWQAIEARTRGLGENVADAVASLKRSLAIWRGFAIGASFAAVAAVAYLGALLMIPQQGAMYVAMLADEQARPAWLVTIDSRSHELTAKPLDVAARTDRAYELWLIPSGGRAPISLGLLNPAAPVRMTMPEPEASMMPQANALAVSVEPPGGSPHKNAPSGPVMHKGPVVSQEF